MFACLSSASISVMVNGSPSKEFKLKRGLRQGDPLSPFLFLIMAEALQITILEACDKGLYKGVSLIESGRIVGVGVSCNEVEVVAISLGCSHDFLPFSYLGLPVGKRMKSCGGWSDVINRFRDRLSSWKAKSLSIGGVGSLLAKNLGLLGKWKWHFLVEKNARWCTVIKDFYGIDGGFRSPPNSFSIGGIWCDIIMSVSCIRDFDSTFNSSFALKISTGVNTSFWANPWVTNRIILKDP
ncbi:hypothetical protein Tco_1557834 [Tanacetum coccineum]